MIITNLQLKQFRNYEGAAFSPGDGVTVLYGPNGVGKTNLLEAIHLCALGRSHRLSQDRELIQKGKEAAACQVTCQRRDGTHQVAVKLTPSQARKKLVCINGKRAARIGEMMGHVTCVMFSPEDLQLVKEGPALRRRFLDMQISQAQPAYFYDLQRYMQALNQRNILLRQMKGDQSAPEKAMLPVWEEQLARYGLNIIRRRRLFMDEMAPMAREKYAAISGREGEVFDVFYKSCLVKENVDWMMASYEKTRLEDIRRGTTSLGPHREDMILTLSGRDMKTFASQGQIRTAALALKLSELTLLTQWSGEAPALLLDDVMSELDARRRSLLLEHIKGVQTFVTCTDESDLAGAQAQQKVKVTLDENAGLARLEC
ncbi:MAG: DNA replication/repair protein RecF [Clostridia bacterium]|nr:DNA replication/repair protein RecF [Clostridia bacterium]